MVILMIDIGIIHNFDMIISYLVDMYKFVTLNLIVKLNNHIFRNDCVCVFSTCNLTFFGSMM